MKRVDFLISRFGIFEGEVHSEAAQEALVAMGARAVPALIAALSHETNGWQAAMTLSEIGAPATRAIPALTKHARDHRSHAHLWSAIALGVLGRYDELFALAQKSKTAWAAIAGLRVGRPTTYPMLATLLDRRGRRDRALAAIIADWLRPGSASYDPRSTDFDAVVAASASSHAVLRMDAACALGSLRGAADRIRSVPILAALLADRSSEVRRLAALALGRCRGHAAPALPQLRALRKDRAKAVRDCAAHAIVEITRKRPTR